MTEAVIQRFQKAYLDNMRHYGGPEAVLRLLENEGVSIDQHIDSIIRTAPLHPKHRGDPDAEATIEYLRSPEFKAWLGGVLGLL